ncbi:MAG: glucosaminidase domain-containing protein [Pseudomonadota bacterium]|nr:glucosaminidase domain-containing protein [Pseudomonadota bacterium]
MIQQTGIALNNSHLLRAAMAFAVIGVIGPGLFQLKPPQWFGSSQPVQVVEILSPPAEVGGEVTLSEDVRAPAQATVAVAVEPPVAEDVVPAQTVKFVETPTPKKPASLPGEAAPEAATQPLRGPNTGPAGTRLAALQQGTAPEIPAVKARRGPSAPATPDAKPRPVKAPDVPPSASAKVSRAAPVPVIVSRNFTRRIPDSHIGLPVRQQKDSFVAMILPLILASNEEIGQRRSAIIRAAESQDRDSLQRWAKLYRVKTEGKSVDEISAGILERADFIPVSLALAQAAIESGWGTSRFARQGNALFGQWAWQASAGIKPAEASNSRAVVRSFPNLFGSVRAYMHNLNTHASYASFRERRKIMRGRPRADLGFQLASHLDGYAEIGTAYVDKLRTLIRTNDFGRFETAKLR